jgi:hypothetical protein
MGYDIYHLVEDSFDKGTSVWMPWPFDDKYYYVRANYALRAYAHLLVPMVSYVKKNRMTLKVCNANEAFYSDLGVYAPDGKEIDAGISYAYSVSYNLPFTSNSFSGSDSLNISQYLPNNGDVQFPNPGKYIELFKTILDFDLLFNKLNFYVIGLTIKPGMLLALTGRSIDFKLNGVLNRFMNENTSVELPRSRDVSDFNYVSRVELRPGLVLEGFIDVAVWSASLLKEFWFDPIFSTPDIVLTCRYGCNYSFAKKSAK